MRCISHRDPGKGKAGAGRPRPWTESGKASGRGPMIDERRVPRGGAIGSVESGCFTTPVRFACGICGAAAANDGRAP